MITETSYGAYAGSAASAAATLRGMVGELGGELMSVDDTDRVAAVVGAEVWIHITKSPLREASRCGVAACKALSAILLRASGDGLPHKARKPGDEDPDIELINVLAAWSEWAEQLLGYGYTEALKRAAVDLSQANSPAFIAAAEALYDYA